MKKISAIILAAGQGKRMGLSINKQFIELNQKPLLYYTLKAFEKNHKIDEIVISAKRSEIQYIKENIVDKYGFLKVIEIVVGGKERQDSVYFGLKALKDCKIVLIHDGARPFVNDRIINEGIENAIKYSACACGITPKDTIKVKGEDNFSIDTPNRSTLFSVQTPQCFAYRLIMDCHEKIYKEKIPVTDDTMVVETYNHKVYLYQGDYTNIKITTTEDLIFANEILKNLEN